MVKINEHWEGGELGLPKWPGVVIVGEPVNPSIGQEVVRRTDKFFKSYLSGGNDRKYNKMITELTKIPVEPDDIYDMMHGSYLDEVENWNKKWGFKRLNYFCSDMISTCYGGGPNSWVCPFTGNIFWKHNIGKYPSISEVISDWEMIVDTWPVFNLDVVVYEEEITNKTEPTTIFGLKVRKDTIDVFMKEPISYEWGRDFIEYFPKKDTRDEHTKIYEYRRKLEETGDQYHNEKGIPLEMIQSWVDQVFIE